MLSIDCEMTGLDPKKHGIISIGAIDMSQPDRQFYGECRIWEKAEIDPAALAVNGFTEKDCLDSQKKTEEQLMRELHDWIQLADEHTLLGQNVYTDKEFLNEAFSRNGIKFKFNHRIIDTHSVAYAEHLRTGKIIPHKYEDQTQSALNLDKILQSVGIPEEPRPHNALTGAKVSAEAFYRLVYNKKLLPEFEEYSIPTEIIC
jgi:DNA polymerase-3 subunit epsilon